MTPTIEAYGLKKKYAKTMALDGLERWRNPDR